MFTVGTDQAKSITYARLKQTEQGAGYCHFPLAYSEEYFKQLTAEKVVTKYRKGFAYREWVKTRPRNEALDCRVYATAALEILNPVWQALKPKQNTLENKPERQTFPRKRTQAQRKRGGFATNWR